MVRMHVFYTSVLLPKVSFLLLHQVIFSSAMQCTAVRNRLQFAVKLSNDAYLHIDAYMCKYRLYCRKKGLLSGALPLRNLMSSSIIDVNLPLPKDTHARFLMVTKRSNDMTVSSLAPAHCVICHIIVAMLPSTNSLLLIFHAYSH